jgi:protein-L-isoaspartate(D-aspartate) O-methyltransferase
MSATENHDEHWDARATMIERQLRRRGLDDERVLAAMAAVPRHRFVPSRLQHAAHEDRALAIGAGQTISQPYMVARACELLELTPSDRVLEVGGGSGYQAAVLAQLCKRVVTVELIESLAERARRTLAELGIDNVRVVTGDGTQGFAEEAPYQAIVVAAGTPSIPDALIEQLDIGGRLVIPVGPDFMQTLTVVRKTASGIEQRGYDGCVYVPLRGGGGWADQDFD